MANWNPNPGAGFNSLSDAESCLSWEEEFSQGGADSRPISQFSFHSKATERETYAQVTSRPRSRRPSTESRQADPGPSTSGARSQPYTFIISNLPADATQKKLASLMERRLKGQVCDVRTVADHRAVMRSFNHDLPRLIKRHIEPEFGVALNVKPCNDSAYSRPLSCVVEDVDFPVTDEEVLKACQEQGLSVSKVCRIKSFKLQRLTKYYRIVTPDVRSIEAMLQHGLTIRGVRHEVVPPKCSAAAPATCSRCFSFDHDCGKCRARAVCVYCGGGHGSSACPVRPPPPAAAAMVRCVDPPLDPASSDALIRFVSTLAVNLHPEERQQTIAVIEKTALQTLGRKVSVVFSTTSKMHVDIQPPY